MAAKLPNIKFDINGFNQLLEQQGVDMILHKVTNCPNRTNLYLESHNIECEMCENGVISYKKIEFTGLVQTANLDKHFKVEGRWLAGSARLTAPSHIDFDYFDVIEIPNAEARYNELIEKSGTQYDQLKYKPTDVMHLVDADNVIYRKDADYSLTKNGKIKWLTNRRPSKGKIVSVAYTYRPRFRVLEHFHFLRDSKQDGTQKAMPRQVLIRIDYLLDNEESDEN